MSLQAEIIPFNLRTGTGTQTINHLVHTGIEAKGIVFICGDNSGAAGEIYGMGFDDGTTHISNSFGINDSFGICTAKGYSTQYSLQTEQAQAFFGGAQRRMAGYVSSIATGNFTITLDLNNTPGAQWYAIILGGTSVSCKVGLYDVTPGSGTVNVGFAVSAVLKLGVPDAGTTGENTGASCDIGFATQCPNDSDQAGWGIFCDAGSRGSSYQSADIIQSDITSTAGGPTDNVTISSWTATGFNVSVTGSPNWNLGYLAIGGAGVSANLVEITQPTTTGVQNNAVEAAEPVIVLFGSTCKVASATPSLNANLMLGAFDGSSQVSQWWGHVDNSINRDRISSTTNAITMATSTGASTSTTDATATCALSARNVALNWTTVDSTQRSVWALVLATNPTPSEENFCGVLGDVGTLIVTKTTVPSGSTQVFDVTGTVDTVFELFTISDGETQTFELIPIGTYTLTEAEYGQWATTYDVSTDESNEFFTISNGQSTTIAITNTRIVPPSGETVQWRLHRFDLKRRTEETS